MSIVTGKIKDLLKVTPKSRFDTYTDQFHRVFMVKMSMVSSVLLGMNWLKDTMSCIVPGNHGIDKKFTSQACWIQGFFVYKQLRHDPGVFGYYGIPTDITKNGFYPSKTKYGIPEPCKVDEGDDCIPYDKTFFLHHQWFPFYVAILGLLFYLPYVFFRANNGDIISLKTVLKAPGDNTVKFADDLIRTYFDRKINTMQRMKRKVVVNVIVKILYILTNVVAFTATDGVLHGEFSSYGKKWLKWSEQPNEEEYDYTSAPHEGQNPASVLLPTFGLCEVIELAKDVKHTLYNKHQFVCEISQNVLYQYVLLLLWFLFVFGMAVSVIGLLMELGDHLLTWYAFIMLQGYQTRKVYASLSFRECNYLEQIRKKDMNTYGEVIRQLKKKYDRVADPYYTDPDQNGGDRRSGPHTECIRLLSEVKDKED